MREIKFSQNWNKKLNCDYFTTIRFYTKSKIDYYDELYERNEELGIILKGEEFCIGKIKEIDIMMLKDIPNTLCMTDVGTDRSQFDKIMENMYQNRPEWNYGFTRMIILCIQKVHEV